MRRLTVSPGTQPLSQISTLRPCAPIPASRGRAAVLQLEAHLEHFLELARAGIRLVAGPRGLAAHLVPSPPIEDVLCVASHIPRGEVRVVGAENPRGLGPDDHAALRIVQPAHRAADHAPGPVRPLLRTDVKERRVPLRAVVLVHKQTGLRDVVAGPSFTIHPIELMRRGWRRRRRRMQHRRHWLQHCRHWLRRRGKCRRCQGQHEAHSARARVRIWQSYSCRPDREPPSFAR